MWFHVQIAILKLRTLRKISTQQSPETELDKVRRRHVRSWITTQDQTWGAHRIKSTIAPVLFHKQCVTHV